MAAAHRFRLRRRRLPVPYRDELSSRQFEVVVHPVGPEEMEHVTLSTVHQAKGLEWRVVIITWLAHGRFPTDFAGREEGGYGEERRVFHVAATRATN